MLDEFNDYLVPHGVAYVLDVSVTTVYKMLRSGKLPGIRVNKKLWRIPKAAFIQYLEDELQVGE